ncbi:MAG: NADH:ubiquinone oxidoreductase subunit NDUFA12 [Stellaceae bacterium]
MTTLGTRLLTLLRGKLVGSDAYGNKYYRLRGGAPTRRGGGRFSRERRWVIYHGEPEGSKVPSEWHAWLHHTTDAVPGPRTRFAWEKDHQPNMTGTPQAYHPRGSILRGGHRAPTTSDYEPWTPQ